MRRGGKVVKSISVEEGINEKSARHVKSVTKPMRRWNFARD